ncbi:hypothetical protein DENIS_4040 [Desulfonema ishimotonii]|uniref:O-antigen ligase-related domain-containing protein n=1 Tax=Desulfonema ishimotonii TaxID=45657 RepID=A0A401G1G1_9BACT|nr:O-antigen ligase family protein [Desulfonema ishimotonii]GBC63051.1 hypothetical protein DENIS_4040 [Desulfonema ishimotonii]
MRIPCLLVPNDLVILTLFIPFLISIALRNLHHAASGFALLTIGLNICVLTIFQSRGGLILSIIAIVLTCCLFKSRRLLAIPFLCLLIVLLSDYLWGFALFGKLKNVWYSRAPAWAAAWEMFTDSPWLGTGPRSFGHLYFSYQQKTALPAWLIVDKRIMPWAHNLYLETLAEQGVPGILSFGILIKFMISDSVAMIRSRNRDIRFIAVGLFSSLVTFLMAGMFELSFIRHWVVIVFFTMAALIATAGLKTHGQQSWQDFHKN